MRSRRTDATDEVRIGGVDRAAVEQRRPHLLAFARALAVVQRAEHGDDRQHRVRRVAHSESVVERGIALVHRGRFVFEPGRRLVERVEATEACQRTLEAVRPRVAVDDVGLDLLAFHVVDPEFGGDARGHVVVDDVGGADELERNGQAARILDVQRDVAFTPLAAEEGLGGHAHAIAGDGFDLDHLGAEVADDHRSERTREVLAEVDQPHAFQCECHSPSSCRISSLCCPGVGCGP